MKLLITVVGFANLASVADSVSLGRASAIMPASARDFIDFTARLPVSVEGPDIRKPPEMVQSAAAVLLYAVTIGLAMATTVLMLCGMYDLAGNWRHRARFHSCQKKVLRVHEASLSKQGDMQLCPFCVEPVSGFPQPSEVVFLCGHRFHMKCANKWFCECPQQAGMCPMCEGPEARDAARSVDSEGASLDCNDEAKSLILSSLHKWYPDIVSNVLVERWSACHTEIWLSELKCPKYQSIFTNQLK